MLVELCAFAVLVALVLAGVLVLFVRFARHPLSVTRWRVPVPRLPCERLVVCHMSDFHVDPSTAHRVLPTVRAAVANAVRCRPDLVVLTGDYVDRSTAALPQLCDALAPLVQAARLGVFASLGNHDAKDGRDARDRVAQGLRAVGVRVLRNERVLVAVDKGEVEVVGLEDMWSAGWGGHAQPLRRNNNDHKDHNSHPPVLVLSHNPDSAAKLGHFACDVQFSGHTHGGQVCLPRAITLPGFTPYGVPVLALVRVVCDALGARAVLGPSRRFAFVVNNWLWAQGLHDIRHVAHHHHHHQQQQQQEQPRWLFVSRGIGSHHNLRLCCPPELAYVTLVREEQQRGNWGELDATQ